MTATVVGPLAAGDPGRYAALAATLAVAVGLLCLVAWAVRLGFVADLLSRPVLVGYLAGVALIMIVDQLPKLTGVRTTGSGLLPPAVVLRTALVADPPATAALRRGRARLPLRRGPLTVRAVPGPLLAVVLATAAVAAFDLDDRHGIKVIGEVPAGLPGLAVPDLAELPHLVLPALGVLLVGYTDCHPHRAGLRRPRRRGPRARRQPGAAGPGRGQPRRRRRCTASRSAAAPAAPRSPPRRAPAARRTRWSPRAAVLAVLLFLSPLLARTPAAVLGALVVYAAVRMIDLAGFRRLASFRRRELLLALGCLAGVLALDILYGVLVAVGLSVAELLTRVARPHDAVEGLVPGVAGMHDVDDYPQARTIPGLLVYRYDSPLFFANAEDFRRRALAAVDEAGPDPVRWFVLNTEANVEVDITALDAVDALRRELTGRGIVFALARVKQDLRDDLDAYGLTESVGTDRIFPTLPTAVAAYRQWSRAQ